MNVLILEYNSRDILSNFLFHKIIKKNLSIQVKIYTKKVIRWVSIIVSLHPSCEYCIHFFKNNNLPWLSSFVNIWTYTPYLNHSEKSWFNKKNDRRGKIIPLTCFLGQYTICIGWKCTIKLPRIEKLYIINHNILLFSIFFLFASVCIKFVTGMHMVTLLQWLGGHMYNPQKHTSVHLCNCMPAQQSSCIFVSSTF